MCTHLGIRFFVAPEFLSVNPSLLFYWKIGGMISFLHFCLEDAHYLSISARNSEPSLPAVTCVRIMFTIPDLVFDRVMATSGEKCIVHGYEVNVNRKTQGCRRASLGSR